MKVHLLFTGKSLTSFTFFHHKAVGVFQGNVLLPNQRKSLLFWQVVDSDLFKQSRLNASPGSKHIYLQTNFNLLLKGALREYRLDLKQRFKITTMKFVNSCVQGTGLGCDSHLWNHSAVDGGSLWSYDMNFLTDTRDDGKVLREVRCQNPRYPVSVQIFKLAQLCEHKIVENE